MNSPENTDCPACKGPIGATPHRHHDHLARLGHEELVRCLAAGHAMQIGPLSDRMRRSERFQRLLRFSGSIMICEACNTLEGAWNVNSNSRPTMGGFLPRFFTLTAGEIGRARAIGAERNSAPEVRAELWRTWTQQECGHKLRMRLIREEARRFSRSLL